MVIILSLLLGFAISLFTWFLCQRLSLVWHNYEDNLNNETRKTLDDIFLFLDFTQIRPLIWLFLGVLALVLTWLTGYWLLVVPVLISCLLLPKFYFNYLRKQRAQAFDQQLPDLLLSLAGAVKAGASLQNALQSIVSTASGPVQQEFTLVLREQRLGLGFAQALNNLYHRLPTEACGLFVSALNIATITGGSLAETLENIATTIRQRLYWSARVKALTAQGRMQSIIMAALPLLLLVVLSYLEPEAMSLLWHTWFGWLFLCGIALLEITGILWIRRIANIDI